MNADRLDRIKVSDVELSVRLTNVIERELGPGATLGDVIRKGGAEWLASLKHCGRRSVREFQDVLEHLTDPVTEREREDGARSMEVAAALLSGRLRIVPTAEYEAFCAWRRWQRGE